MVEEVEDTGKKANNSEPPFNYPNHPKLVLPSPPLTSLIGIDTSLWTWCLRI